MIIHYMFVIITTKDAMKMNKQYVIVLKEKQKEHKFFFSSIFVVLIWLSVHIFLSVR